MSPKRLVWLVLAAVVAAGRGTTFVHVELNRAVREDAGRTATVVDALAAVGFP